MSSLDGEKSWRFLSNHTQVLLCIQRDPDVRFRDIAQMVGITEKLQQVGVTGDTKSLDEAIDQFYNKRFGEEKETVNDRKK